MTCSEHQTNVSRLLDNELPEESQTQTFAHLASCTSCRDFFGASRFIRQHLEVMPDFPDEIGAPVLKAEPKSTAHPMATHRGPRKSLLARRIMIPLPAAAAILLVLAASIVFSIDAYDASARAEEQVIYVPTLPGIEVEASSAANQQSEEIIP